MLIEKGPDTVASVPAPQREKNGSRFHMLILIISPDADSLIRMEKAHRKRREQLEHYESIMAVSCIFLEAIMDSL